MLGTVLWAAAGVLMLAWVVVALVSRRLLLRLWREPVLVAPVMIVESDDWGPAPPSDTEALVELAALFERHRDHTGRHPVLTLGVVCAVADREAIVHAGYTAYHRLRLADERFGPLRAVMRAGVGAGVFALHLHGMEHYWPPALMGRVERDARLREWFEGRGPADAEALPAELQTRWVDCRTLPSQPLAGAEIATAVMEEIREFKLALEAAPEVAVPPTFVWTAAVERAWAQAGIRTIITPGMRHEARDQDGRPQPGPRLANGERAAGGAVYLVRDIYFEPARGHTADGVWPQVQRKWRQGRPALLETHRCNFVGDGAARRRSFDELERLLRQALKALPQLRFMSAAELADEYRQPHSTLFARGWRPRLGAWLERVEAMPLLMRRLRYSGLGLPVAGLKAVARAPGGRRL